MLLINQLNQGFWHTQTSKIKNDVISICIKIRKNPCYAGVLRAFQPSFSCNEKFTLKPQKCRQNVAEMSHPSNPCGSKVQGTFSRFGTRHLKGGRSNPLCEDFSIEKSPKFSHSKNKKKRPVMVFLIFNSGSLQLKAEGSPTPDT